MLQSKDFRVVASDATDVFGLNVLILYIYALFCYDTENRVYVVFVLPFDYIVTIIFYSVDINFSVFLNDNMINSFTDVDCV